MQITCDMLKKWNACYYAKNDLEMIEVLDRLFPMTPLELLACEELSIGDRFWVLLRPEVILEPDLHELGCRFTEDVLYIWDAEYPHDARPRNAIDAKRKWLRGEICDRELGDARAARAACRAARESAWHVAQAACRVAAWESAWHVARAACRAAARESARVAARAAAMDAWLGAGGLRPEIECKQIKHVREILEKCE